MNPLELKLKVHTLLSSWFVDFLFFCGVVPIHVDSMTKRIQSDLLLPWQWRNTAIEETKTQKNLHKVKQTKDKQEDRKDKIGDLARKWEPLFFTVVLVFGDQNVFSLCSETLLFLLKLKNASSQQVVVEHGATGCQNPFSRSLPDVFVFLLQWLLYHHCFTFCVCVLLYAEKGWLI